MSRLFIFFDETIINEFSNLKVNHKKIEGSKCISMEIQSYDIKRFFMKISDIDGEIYYVFDFNSFLESKHIDADCDLLNNIQDFLDNLNI